MATTARALPPVCARCFSLVDARNMCGNWGYAAKNMNVREVKIWGDKG